MNLVIIGASGLAREVFDLANICYKDVPGFRIKGFLSDGPSNIEEMGYPPVLNTVDGYEISPGDLFFCAIGKVSDRKKTTEIILTKGGRFINLIHPTAIISPSAKIGVGVAIKAFSSLASDVTIGNFVYLQSSVIIGHDVKIGDYCQVNSFAFFAGHVQIEELCTINAGAKLIQNVKVGRAAVVGIGSVVLSRVKSETTVFGVPAKIIL
ncbi:MAG: NeuD/PglB/VioB family sugar acetyltransferase [Bacteroidia bacterium]|nr:NeuD/PglB/VioB family sugar acetyltransferase [Bacteroidia bacterium]MCF8445932.1 NeuD/PglB/VioB family sugar acetyltransferase [Bacteroidia bacterium]